MTTYLNWPNESATPDSVRNGWQQPGSNICLDFHGDPVTARLVIFSDGNHHMALQKAVQIFLQGNTSLNDIFYVTAPPSVLVNCMEQNGLSVGNLVISRSPDIFIGPESVMKNLLARQIISHHQAFARSQGNVLLIKKGNPKNITQIQDLLRQDITLFISNPETEQASFQVYRDSLLGICEEQGIEKRLLDLKLGKEKTEVMFGEKIHHREAPQAIFSGAADTAMVYYHLALRYCRIFPEQFDFIPLGGSRDNPQPTAGNMRTDYHVAQVNSADNKDYAKRFIKFILSPEGSDIYKSHGLIPVS